jgi:hypothetical protein
MAATPFFLTDAASRDPPGITLKLDGGRVIV